MLTLTEYDGLAVQGGTPMIARGEDSLLHWLGAGRHSSLSKYPRGDRGADSPPARCQND
jgi:hypothetical protein